MKKLSALVTASQNFFLNSSKFHPGKMGSKLIVLSIALLSPNLLIALNFIDEKNKFYFFIEKMDTLLLTVIGIFIFALGFVFLLVALFQIIHPPLQDKVLFYFPGFANARSESPTEPISNQDGRDVLKVSTNPFDSYATKTLQAKLKYIQTRIDEKQDRNGITDFYACAIGSVPYTYCVGTFFNNTYGSVLPLEKDLLTGKGKKLNDYGELDEDLKLSFTINNSSMEPSDIGDMNPGLNQKVILAIEFTAELKNEQIPSDLTGSDVARIRIGDDYRHEKIISYFDLNKASMYVHDIIIKLTPIYEEIHLILITQASFVFKLGTLYQPNMYRGLHIYNFDSCEQNYNWHIRLTGVQTEVVAR